MVWTETARSRSRQVLGEAQGARLQYRAVNSCIRLAHSVQGQALWTAQDLIAADGSLHPVQQAMVQFIELHPNWDQYRLVQAALAGFLVQNGIESREITRVYVGNMFRRESLLHGV